MSRQPTPSPRTLPSPVASLFPALGALFLVATPAQAHIGLGTGAGFASGLAHPFLGLDHLLAMVSVGLWAGFTGGRATWLWPLAFVGTMAAAALMGMLGAPLPLVEPGILASVLVLGALLGAAARTPAGVGAGVVAFFALFHGHAHGTEAPAAAAGLLYVAGFALATAALHAAGVWIAARTEGDPERALLLRRGAASVVVAAGLLLLVV
jgi:urease accessory protein